MALVEECSNLIGDVIVDPSLEHPDYHLLSQEKLEELDDVEALFERGRRQVVGIGVSIDESLGWLQVVHAAQLGHGVALAACYCNGKGIEENLPRAIELFTQTSERGHPAGTSVYTVHCTYFTARSASSCDK
jgi:hypothetical protein